MDVGKVVKAVVKNVAGEDVNDDFVVVVPHVQYFRKLLNVLNK